MTIDGSTIAGNRAECSVQACRASGGGLRLVNFPATGGSFRITRSAIVENEASCAGPQCEASGVGIWASTIFGAGNLVNATVSNNSANCAGLACIQKGGGMTYKAETYSTLHVSFTTIAFNSGAVGESGVRGEAAPGFGAVLIVRVKNSMVVSKTGSACDFDAGTTLAVFGTNLATDNTCTGFTQKTTGQLKLSQLKLNSPGTTKTHALLAGSQAINAALSCTDDVGSPVTTDQRGVNRPQGSACDVGAYERVP